MYIIRQDSTDVNMVGKMGVESIQMHQHFISHHILESVENAAYGIQNDQF